MKMPTIRESTIAAVCAVAGFAAGAFLGSAPDPIEESAPAVEVPADTVAAAADTVAVDTTMPPDTALPADSADMF